MINQYLNQASVGELWRLYKENVEKQGKFLDQILEAYEESQKSLSNDKGEGSSQLIRSMVKRR